MTATPVSGSTAGPNGIYVVPSNALTTAPAAVAGTTNPVELGMGYVGYYTIGYTAESALFVATGSDSMRHIYRMSLTDTAAVPTAIQVSNLIVPGTATSVGCNQNYTTLQTNANDPTSLYALIEVPPTSGGTCGAGDVYDLVPYAAASTTAPVQTPLTPNADSLYSSQETLSGAVQLDASNNLAFYTYNGSNFTEAATPIATGVTNTGYVGFSSTPGETEVFELVTVAAGTRLIGVNSSGGVTLTYAVQGSVSYATLYDASNLYFMDATSTTVNVLYVPFGQSSVTATSIVSLPVSTYGTVRLVGSAGGNLLFSSTTGSGSTAQTTVYSVAITAGATMLTAKGASNTATTYTDVFLDSTAAYLYFDVENEVTPGPTGTFVASLANSSVLESVNNSKWIAFNGVLEGAVFRESNLSTDASGGTGGATFDVLNTATLSDPQLMNPSTNTAFTIPTGYSLGASYALLYSTPADTTNIGYVQLYGTAGDQAELTDLSQHLMVPVTISGATTATTNIDAWN